MKSFLDGTRTYWQLRDPIYLEVGIDYKINIQIPNPDYPDNSTEPFMVIQRNLAQTQPRGLVTTILLAGDPIPSLPDYAQFAFEHLQSIGLPKPFRIVNVAEISGHPDDLEITALEINRLKWDYIDNGGDVEQIQHSFLTDSDVQPPTNIKVYSSDRNINGVSTRVLTIAFEKSETRLVRRYKISASRDGGEFYTLAEVSGTEFDYINPPTGDFVFRVIAVTITGRESMPVILSYKMIGDTLPVLSSQNLRLVDPAGTGVFATRSPSFVWS